MAAKKIPSRKPVDPAPKKKSTADIDNMTSIRAGMKQAAAYKKNNLDRKDANGNSYFGAGYPKGGNPKSPKVPLPPGTPWKKRTPNPSMPKSTPSVTPPKSTPSVTPPTTTTTTTPSRGMNQLGKLVGNKSESAAKKKKK
jgi:hypothetical protein